MLKFLRAFLILAIAMPPSLYSDTVVEEIIARVNNQIITRSDFQHEQQQLKDVAHHGYWVFANFILCFVAKPSGPS